MRTQTEHELLSWLSDSHEIVVRATTDDVDPLLAAWRVAATDAQDAYDAWCLRPSALTYAAYVALRDQADCAMASLELDRAAAAVPAGPHAPRRLAA